MECKKCGTSLDDGSKFCGVCGAVIDDNQTVVNSVGSHDNGSNDMKPKKGLIFPIVLLLVIALAVGGVYYYFNNKGRIVKSLINDAFEKFDGLTIDNEYNLESQSVLISGDLSLNTNISELQDLNGEKLNYSFGLDYPNKKIEIGASLEEDGLNLIEAAMYLLDDTAYISLKDNFDKLIKIESAELSDIFSVSNGLNLSQDDIDYIVKAYKKILIDSIDSRDFDKSSATIVLNGKDTKVTKLTYNLTGAKAQKLVNNIIYETMNDSKLLNILSKASGLSVDELKSQLEMSKIDGLYDDSEMISFDIYTKGFNNSFVGMDIQGIVKIRKNNDNVTIEAGLGVEKVSLVIKSINDDSCVVEFNSNIGGEVIKGNLTLTSKEIEKNVYEGSVVFDLTYGENTFSISNKFNEKIGVSISDVDVSNAVDFESLSEDDLNRIEESISSKFMNSKLYKLIESLSYSDYSYDEYDYDI